MATAQNVSVSDPNRGSSTRGDILDEKKLEVSSSSRFVVNKSGSHSSNKINYS